MPTDRQQAKRILRSHYQENLVDFEVPPCRECGRALPPSQAVEWLLNGREAWTCATCTGRRVLTRTWPWPRVCALCAADGPVHAHHVLKDVKHNAGGSDRSHNARWRVVREERVSTCLPLCERCHNLVHAVRPPALWGVTTAVAAVWTPGLGLTLVVGPDESTLLSPAELRALVADATVRYLDATGMSG